MKSQSVSNQAHPSTGNQFTEWGGLYTILSDALVIIPSALLMLGGSFSLVSDLSKGADLGQSLIALALILSSVGFGFLLLRALYRFKVEFDDETNQ